MCLVVAACDHVPPANGTFDLADQLSVTVPPEAVVYDRNEANRQYHLPGGAEMDIEVADAEATCKPTDSPAEHTRCIGSHRITIRFRNDHSDDRDTKIVTQVTASLKTY